MSHLGKLIENVIANFVRKDIKSKLYWREPVFEQCNQFNAFLGIVSSTENTCERRKS